MCNNPAYIPAQGSFIANEYGTLNKFKELYLLVRKKDVSIDKYIDLFKNPNINPFQNNKDILLECFELTKIVYSFLKIKHIKNSLILIEGTDLQIFNKNMLDENYLLCIELYLDKDTLLNYIENIEKKSLTDFIKLRIVGTYLNDNLHTEQFIDIMKNIKEFQSWKNYYFLKINENDNFKNKTFKNLETIKNAEYSNINTILINTPIEYPEHINNDLNINEIHDFYNLLSEKEQKYFINLLMCSRDLCHFIFDDLFITKINEKHLYPLRYTFLSLYQMECNSQFNSYIKNKISPLIMLSLDKLNMLPIDQTLYNIYPFNHNLINENIRWNPLINQNKTYKLVSIETFKERLNIFCTGNKDIDIFKNLDWSNIAITGSFMASSLPLYNNIMLNFDYKYLIEKEYNDADLDIMCCFKTNNEFVDKVYKVKKVVEENLNSKIKIDIINMICIMIDKHMLENELNIKADKNNPELIMFIYNIIIYHLMEKRKTIPAKEILENQILYKLPDENSFNIIFKDDIDETNKDNFYYKINNKILFKAMFGFRFRLSSHLLKHEIELFNIGMKYDNDDPKLNIMVRVSSFHLSCVRSFYDGINCYLSPTAYICLTTFILHDFRYISGSKTMHDIILKYMKRGFNYTFNYNEYNEFIKYGENNYRNFNCNSKEEFITNIPKLKELNYNHPLFKITDNTNYINPIYNIKYNIISNDGNIMKLKTWIFDELIDD